MEEENTNPEAITGESNEEPASEIDTEVTAEDTSPQENENVDMSEANAEKIELTDENEDKEVGDDALQEEKIGDEEEPTETEEVDAEEKLDENGEPIEDVEKAEVSEAEAGEAEAGEAEASEVEESEAEAGEAEAREAEAGEAGDVTEQTTDVTEEPTDVSEKPADETEQPTDETSPKESDVTAGGVPEEEAPKPPDKKPTLEKKDSMDYDTIPRYTEDFEEAPRASGDFLVIGEDTGAPVKFYKYMEEGEEEEEEVIELEVVEEVIQIDRTPYYEKHTYLTKLLEDERLQNNILQKKLAMFFKRRRMEHVLKETDQQVDTQQKYGKKLDTFGELLEIDTRQRNTVTQELENLKEARETKYYELQKLFDNLQAREKEIGFGLINTKTGNPIPDKLVEKLIRRQKSELEIVCDMRLKFIKLKYLIAEKQEAITIIDKIGEDLYLMDFEQLKVENRGLADKIEERDEELTKLRSKCQTTIQILAHIREKTAALESDFDDLRDDLSVVDNQSLQIREQLNNLKQQRDYYRNLSNKLRNDSGLLTEIELLRDMEDSMGELQLRTEELENLKTENKIKAQQIRNIRKNIEYAEGLAKRSYKNIPEKSLTGPHFYKGRPSIFSPTLPEDAFKHLKYFKPKSTIGKSKRKKSDNS